MDENVFASLPALRESTEEAMLDMLPVVIWYQSDRSGKEYWCYRCGAHGHISKLQRTETQAERSVLYGRHKWEAQCPECLRSGRLACIGTVRGSYGYNTHRWALVVSPVSETEVWIREMQVSYSPGFWDDRRHTHMNLPSARPRIGEIVRYHLTPGKAKEYCKGWGGWEETTEIWDETKLRYPWYTEGYRAGTASQMFVEGDLADTFLRYNSYEKADHGMYAANIACYLANYAKYPSIEMMVKAGFSGIVYDLVVNRKENRKVVDWTQTDPRKAFGMSKTDLEKLRRCNDQPRMLQNYHRYKNKGEKDPFRCAEMVERWKPSYGWQRWKETLKRCGATDLELFRYFEKIERENPGCHMAVPPPVDRTWHDYIRAAEDIGYDTTNKSVVMPRDLYGKHDSAVALASEMREEKKYGGEGTAKRFEERAPELMKKYAKTGERYFVRVPQHPREIIAEGAALSHCVGGFNYIKNHAAGKNPILFLRRTDDPDTPFYTMEINHLTNEILQCEGGKSADGHGKYGHIHRDDLPEDAKAFLDAWESERVKIKKSRKKDKTA